MGRQPETREHYRLVLKESGVSLRHFATRRELLSVLIDAVEAHKRMYGIDVLHRDIRFHNIMISTFEKEKPGERPGRLLDWDYGKTLTRPTTDDPEEYKNHHSGTLPFMSVHLLLGDESTEHKVHHDLESFLYVLCWACITLEGPGQYRRSFDIMKSQLKFWLVGDTVQGVAYSKLGHLLSRFDNLLADFHPYFEPLKETVRNLWGTFHMSQSFGPDYVPPTYDEFLAVLKVGRDALPLVDDPPPEN
ncbi:hypothetical protein PUNSTDRAFT_133687 [Punctularia strigosozonata HHB-11173 SS5]|uniref:uncharacterized protein n=1 Tax=Punctularia strigosozonata (strain HHB-11173) TaxID=741275 RepID=UPI00044164B9|nr:uncharacterized protein PUNSTDRAFT_133687 [Punctularia strigosozonata HHB-11173 SS5]EIN09914.1 hypothetical protein PUNSTDRAFT_133687 [Punctularia strigosozonata HHB-11173 SS5]